MNYKTKRRLQKLGVVLLGIGAGLVSTVINAAANAIGIWIVLEQFDYSLPSFWAYIIAGLGLAIILQPATSSNS